MSIARFASHQAFDPETVEMLASVYNKLCTQLGLSPMCDRMTELVARHVIEVAQMGVRNETAIQLAVLQEFKSNPQ